MNKIKNIDIKDIPRIEKALEIKLFPEVIRYLTTNEECYFPKRRTGKTYAYMIKLILTCKDELSLIDMQYKGNRVDEWHGRNYNSWFAHKFRETRNKLKYYGGFDVVKIREDK